MRSLGLLLVFAACTASTPPRPAPAAPGRSEPTPAVGSWRDAVPEPGPARTVSYPPAEVRRLSNGVPLYFLPRPGGLVTLSVVALGGSAEDGPGRSGLAALTVRMMTEGTSARSGIALAEAAADLGTNLGVDVRRDHVRLTLTGLAADHVALSRLLAEVVTQPSFEGAALERVRAEVRDDLLAERQDPSSLGAIAGMRAVLGPGLGAPPHGTPDDVRGLRRRDLVDFHRAAFGPKRIALCVTGDLTATEALADAEEAFGRIAPARPRPVRAGVETAALSPGIYVVDRPGAVQTAIFAAHPFPKRDEPGHEARQVMNDAVGGLFTSRLNASLREAHAYTYGARSMALASREYGAFAIMTSVRADVTTEAIAEIRSELGALSGRRVLSEEETARARADLLQSVGAHLENLSALREDLETLFVDRLPPDYFATYGSRILTVDAARAQGAAAGIAPDALVFVVVGDRAAFGSLAKLGLPVADAPAALTR